MTTNYFQNEILDPNLGSKIWKLLATEIHHNPSLLIIELRVNIRNTYRAQVDFGRYTYRTVFRIVFNLSALFIGS